MLVPRLMMVAKLLATLLADVMADAKAGSFLDGKGHAFVPELALAHV